MNDIIQQQWPTALSTPRIYKMDHPSRGQAIIISNGIFSSPHLDSLPGSVLNVNYIANGLKHNKFEIDLSYDQTTSEIMDIAKSVANDDHSKADCLVFCINSHGSEGGICGTDFNHPRDLITIQDIVEPFKGDNCPSLVGKPKIFIINACGGPKEDTGVNCHTVDTLLADTRPSPKEKIPKTADILIFTSSYPGYVSTISDTVGSFFMMSLDNHLCQLGQVISLQDILLMVKEDVAYHRENAMVRGRSLGIYQMPKIDETLRGKIYFGKHPDGLLVGEEPEEPQRITIDEQAD